MCEVKVFKIEQNFTGVEDLYKYLLENTEVIEALTELKIQKPLKDIPFCLTGKEIITERNILFFASKSEFPESLGELIVLAGAFDVDIVVSFMPKVSITYLESLNWLQRICNADIEFIVGEASF